jgi:hypothetical protein
MSDGARNAGRRHSRCREAYLRCLPELRALAAGELHEVDVEVDEAVSTVLNALPNVRRVRPLLTQLPGVDMKIVDSVESYALAALYTHFRFVASGRKDFTELIERARAQRAQLCGAVAALPEHARGIESNPETPEDLAYDLLRRAELARTYLHGVLPEQKELKTTLEIATKAELQAEEILASLEASQERPTQEQLREERMRAFTLFVDAYEDRVRPAIAELCRRKDDLDAMARAYAFQAVAEKLGPEAVHLLGPDRGGFGEN